jgi:hypothetical protein
MIINTVGNKGKLYWNGMYTHGECRKGRDHFGHTEANGSTQFLVYIGGEFLKDSDYVLLYKTCVPQR